MGNTKKAILQFKKSKAHYVRDVSNFIYERNPQGKSIPAYSQ